MDRHFLNGRQIVLDDEEFMEGSGYGADCCWRYGLEWLGCSLALNEHKMEKDGRKRKNFVSGDHDYCVKIHSLSKLQYLISQPIFLFLTSL
jgi:hypothetical protein